MLIQPWLYECVVPLNFSCLSSLWSSWSWSLVIGRGRLVSQKVSPPIPSLLFPGPQRYLCRASECGPHMAAPQTWLTWRCHWRTLWQTFQWPEPQTCRGLQCFGDKNRRNGLKRWSRFLDNHMWDILLPTHVQPESPNWTGWLYHWISLSLCCDTLGLMK